MTWPSRAWRAPLVALLALSLVPAHAFAQPPAPAPAPAREDADSPTAHFRRAREHYQAGNYKEAIAELEIALAKDPNDPNAKILVYNLGVVHEKRGDIDDALKYFRQYASMDLTPEERKKNEIDLRRLEGAKRELDAKRAAENDKPPQVVVVKDTVVTSPPNGRIDALTIGVGAAAIVGLGVGTIFAIKANADKPPSGFVTGRDGTYNDLQDKASKAHREAVVADVGFAVGIAAGVATVLLYALRPRDVQKKPETPPPPVTGRVSAGPLPGGGGAVLLSGTF